MQLQNVTSIQTVWGTLMYRTLTGILEICYGNKLKWPSPVTNTANWPRKRPWYSTEIKILEWFLLACLANVLTRIPYDRTLRALPTSITCNPCSQGPAATHVPQVPSGQFPSPQCPTWEQTGNPFRQQLGQLFTLTSINIILKTWETSFSTTQFINWEQHLKSLFQGSWPVTQFQNIRFKEPHFTYCHASFTPPQTKNQII